MWYDIMYDMRSFVLNSSLALWVFIDAKKRMNHVVGWPLGTLFFLIVLLPIYLAKRNLKEGEIRSGGTGWNILRYFAALWTIVIAVSVILWLSLYRLDTAQQYTSEVEQAGATIGAVMALGTIFFIWFGVLVGALVLGLILKDSNIVEKGPTGPLANTE